MEQNVFTDAANFDRGMRFLEVMGLRRLRERLLARIGAGRVLEVGAGTGANLRLYESRHDVVALDHSEPMLRGLRRKDPERSALCADAAQLPLPGGYFDVVVGTLVFCSIHDPRRAMSELKRVLRPGGQLLLLEHVRGRRPLGRLATDLLHPLWYAIQGECHLNRETGRFVREAGFSITYESHYLFGVLLLMEAQAP